MIDVPSLGLLLVALVAGAMIVAQLAYPPHVNSRGRRFLRWALLVGAGLVVLLVSVRVVEIVRNAPV